MLRAACELLNSTGVWCCLCSVLLPGSIQGQVHPWIMRLQKSELQQGELDGSDLAGGAWLGFGNKENGPA